MFEATGIPLQWRERARGFDLIIVPNESCRTAWDNGGVPRSKLRVCPLGVDGAFFSQPVAPLALRDARGRPVSSYRQRFLNVGEVRPRKNHLGLVRTWLTTTRSDDDAILILKCAVPAFLMDDFQADVERMLARTGRSYDDAASVLVLNGVFSDEHMRALYHSATHYVSMSHGEGWDLAMMEAAAAGLRLIAPDHSSYRTYLERADAEWIPADEVQVSFEGRVGREDLEYFRGLSWWQPDEAAAGEIFAKIIRGGEARRPPTERLLREYGWHQASRRLLAVLQELS
jgi:glycosyltransferase involved in cell wall biosynthesis